MNLHLFDFIGFILIIALIIVIAKDKNYSRSIAPPSPNFNWKKFLKLNRAAVIDLGEIAESLINLIKKQKKYFAQINGQHELRLNQLDENISKLHFKFDQLFKTELSVNLNALSAADKQKLIDNLSESLQQTDFGYSPSLSLPTKNEAIEATIYGFVKEMVSEHSEYSIQKQVNINGVRLQVTLDILGDADNDPNGQPIEGFAPSTDTGTTDIQ